MIRLAVGDRAHLVPRSRRRGLNEFSPRNGRVVTIAAVRAGAHGRHRYFRIRSNSAAAAGTEVWLRSDEFRPLDGPLMAGGKRRNAGRKSKST